MSPELINLIVQATFESLYMVGIAALLGDSPGLRPEDVFVVILDAAKENWSVGHGLAQFA